MESQTKGLSVRQLAMVFFGAVGLCAIFFALGFLVGANRRAPQAAPVVEQVPPPSEIPTPINPPLQDSQASGPPPTSSRGAQTATVVEQNLPPSRPPVKKTASAPTRSVAPTAQPTSPTSIMIQVAALRTEGDAQSLAHELKSHGYRAVVVTPAQARAGDNFYRVQVGPFSSRADAIESVHKLGRQGFKPFIKE